ITGKGRGRSDPGAASWASGDDELGVLRRSVPRWLAEPPLRGLVIACQPASVRHGGDGAFYVLLRRKRRAGHE
ncbi:MAG: Smr/MutS family protein, partial [Hyphomicrobiaceae bacterium]